jgi:biopolymer transport protein ExbD
MGLLTGGGRGLQSRRRRGPGAVIEMTPLIDIVFQLLIFFLLTATFQDNSSLDVDLEHAKNQEKAREQKSVVVSISDDGRFEIEGKVVDERELEMRMCASAKAGRTTLHIRADKESRHSELVRTMDLAKTCGFAKLGILHRN